MEGSKERVITGIGGLIMKNVRKIMITVVLSFICCVCLQTIQADAATVSKGKCGTNATWIFDSSGVLTIKGSGSTNDYSSSTQPWGKYRDKIKKIVVKKGIEIIGDMNFYGCTKVTSVSLPSGLRTIETNAFMNCYALKSIKFPNTLGILGSGVFSNCYGLKKVTFTTNRPLGLTGEIFSMSMLKVYCPDKYLSNYKQLLEFRKNMATYTWDMNPSVICTGGTAATLDETNLKLDASKKTAKLTASVGNVKSGLKISWHSADSSIAKISKNGVVKATGKHGSTLVYAEVSYKGKKTIVTCNVRYKDNAQMIRQLPTKGLKVDFPTNNSAFAYSEKDGSLTEYTSFKFRETNTSNPDYQKILKQTKKIIAGCKTDREKADRICSWVHNYITYGGSLAGGDGIEQIYWIYNHPEGRCQAYTDLNGLMLYFAGIPNAMVTSMESGHAWNLALVNGKWVMSDATNNSFDFSYNNEWHQSITSICFGYGNMCMTVDDTSGVKLSGIGVHELRRDDVKTVKVPGFVKTVMSHAMSGAQNLKSVYVYGKGTTFANNFLGDYMLAKPTVYYPYNSSSMAKLAKAKVSANLKFYRWNPATGQNYKKVETGKLKVKLSAKKKKTLVVSWKKNSQADGYEIQYAKKSSYKGKKTVTVKGRSKQKATVKKLKSGQRYYVRVRFYKTVGKTKIYSRYSNKASVKVK